MSAEVAIHGAELGWEKPAWTGIALYLMTISSLPPIVLAVPMLLLVMGLLGMGNGAIFQIAPQRFSADIELLTALLARRAA